MPRPKKIIAEPEQPKRWTFDGVPGSVENRNGRAHYRIGSKHVAAGFEFVETNKKKAERELRSIQKKKRDLEIAKRVNAALGISTARTALDEEISIAQAQKKFTKDQLSEATISSRKGYTEAFKTVFPVDAPLTDANIRKLIDAWLDAPEQQAKGTIRNKRGRISAFIEYCRESGWITKNPLKIKRGPKREKKKVIIYSERQEKRIHAWFCRLHIAQRDGTQSRYSRLPEEKKNACDFKRLWKLLAVTGMRLGEALSLLPESGVKDRETDNYITDDAIILNRTKHGKRQIPYREIPGGTEAVEAVLAHAERSGRLNKGRVFPWSSKSAPEVIFRQCLRELGIDGGSRPIHVWRATCEDRLKRWGMSPELFTRFIGHSMAVYEQHYESEMDAIVVAADIQRERKVRGY